MGIPRVEKKPRPSQPQGGGGGAEGEEENQITRRWKEAGLEGNVVTQCHHLLTGWGFSVWLEELEMSKLQIHRTYKVQV